jgi:hypothetical protein
VSTTELNEHLRERLGWPAVGQVFRVVRERTVAGRTGTEVVYGVTSLTRERADAARLLRHARTHWHIENRLHHVRDVTFGEDACRVRRGSAPRLLAAVRNLALHLIEPLAFPSKAAALRRFAAKPFEALGLVRDN